VLFDLLCVAFFRVGRRDPGSQSSGIPQISVSACNGSCRDPAEEGLRLLACAASFCRPNTSHRDTRRGVAPSYTGLNLRQVSTIVGWQQYRLDVLIPAYQDKLLRVGHSRCLVALPSSHGEFSRYPTLSSSLNIPKSVLDVFLSIIDTCYEGPLWSKVHVTLGDVSLNEPG